MKYNTFDRRWTQRPKAYFCGAICYIVVDDLINLNFKILCSGSFINCSHQPRLRPVSHLSSVLKKVVSARASIEK